MRKKTVSVTVLSLLAMLTLPFNIQPVAPQPPVVIGWSHPLTGPVAATCAVHHLYYQMIIDDYNAKGGLNVSGAGLRTINYIEYDDEYDPAHSLDNYEYLITVDNVDLLFAPWSAEFCVNALGLFEAYQYPVVGLMVASNELSELLKNGTCTYFFVTLGQPFEAAHEVNELVAYINAEVDEEDEIGSAGILYRADVHGIGHAVAIAVCLTAMGIAVPYQQIYWPHPPPSDWEPFVNALEVLDVDMVVMCGYDECAAFVQECIAQEYNPKLLMVGPSMQVPSLVYDTWGFTPGEMCGVAGYTGFPATAYETPTLKAWADEHEDYAGYLPFPASALFYSGLECLFEAVETPGIGLNRQAIRDALATQTFDTLAGKFTFRAGESPVVACLGTLTQWQGGEMMEVIWPPAKASTDFIIYPKFPWDYPCHLDIDKNGKINIRDISRAARAFGSYPGHPRWDEKADVNGDDKVNIRDIAAIARAFGQTAPFGACVRVAETFEQRRDRLIERAREVGDDLVDEALDNLRDHSQGGTIHDGGDLGEDTTGETDYNTRRAEIDTQDPGNCQNDGHFWDPEDVDHDTDGDDYDVMNTIVHESRHVWQSWLTTLTLNEADVDMDLNGDGDKTDKNVSNDIDGDGLPTWVPQGKTFNDRPAGQDVQDDDPTTPLPWDPDGDGDPNDNDAVGRLERDAYDFQERFPKGPP